MINHSDRPIFAIRPSVTKDTPVHVLLIRREGHPNLLIGQVNACFYIQRDDFACQVSGLTVPTRYRVEEVLGTQRTFRQRDHPFLRVRTGRVCAEIYDAHVQSSGRGRFAVLLRAQYCYRGWRPHWGVLWVQRAYVVVGQRACLLSTFVFRPFGAFQLLFQVYPIANFRMGVRILRSQGGVMNQVRKYQEADRVVVSPTVPTQDIRPTNGVRSVGMDRHFRFIYRELHVPMMVQPTSHAFVRVTNVVTRNQVRDDGGLSAQI